MRCADLLVGAGRPEEAWRHLSSIIERHPAEGSAYRDVAETFELRGELREAAALWQRAIEVEPTNPTWLVRRAQALIALGEMAKARRLLERVTAGKWQERFDGEQAQAGYLREQLKGR